LSHKYLFEILKNANYFKAVCLNLFLAPPKFQLCSTNRWSTKEKHVF